LIEPEDSMAKKLKELIKDEEMRASAVRTSAQQIWQAGLGAFAKAQEEGGRVFNKLVQEGTEFQKRSRSLAQDRVAGMSDMADKVADGFGKQASGSWDKLEQVFEERVSRALGSIGVPTRKDIEALASQVDELREMVARLSDQAGMAATPAARRAARTASRKPAAKKAAPRKSAAKTSAL
jgi:poly(hydroxyalkanoate) granule-associated protein